MPEYCSVQVELDELQWWWHYARSSVIPGVANSGMYPVFGHIPHREAHQHVFLMLIPLFLNSIKLTLEQTQFSLAATILVSLTVRWLMSSSFCGVWFWPIRRGGTEIVHVQRSSLLLEKFKQVWMFEVKIMFIITQKVESPMLYYSVTSSQVSDKCA